MRRSAKGRASQIVSALRLRYPQARIRLKFETPMQLLSAVILSAQCTDERVNMVTRTLFARCRTPGDFASIGQRTLEGIIHSAGFFHVKAAHIRASARMIIDRFGGEVPRTMDRILCLPGVARKTANIVLGTLYGVVEGIAVDTHVRRVSLRLGLTASQDPEKIEQDLMKIFDRADWFALAYLFQSLGRDTCTARRSDHEQCPLAGLCPRRKTPHS